MLAKNRIKVIYLFNQYSKRIDCAEFIHSTLLIKMLLLSKNKNLKKNYLTKVLCLAYNHCLIVHQRTCAPIIEYYSRDVSLQS